MGKSQRQTERLKKESRRPSPAISKRSPSHSYPPEASSAVIAPSVPNAPLIPAQRHIQVYQKLLRFLRPSTRNLRVRHRESEKDMLREFIRGCFDADGLPANAKANPAIMIVFGQAGLGKTLLLREMLSEMHETQLGRLMRCS